MDFVDKIVSIIVSVVGILVILGNAISFLKQTDISITLKTHEEREKYKLIRGVVFFVLTTALWFVILFSVNTFTIAFGDSRQYIAGINKNVAPFFVITYTVAIIVGALVSIKLKRKEIRVYKEISWRDHFRIFYVFISIILEIVLFATSVSYAIAMPIDNYVVGDLLLSIMVGIIATLILSKMSRSDYDAIALFKTTYKGEEVFLFEMKGDSLVAGDERIMSECQCFYLISQAELEGPIVKSNNVERVMAGNSVSSTLSLKQEIIEKLIEIYGDKRVFVLATKDYDLTTDPTQRNKRLDRSKWADACVKTLFDGKDRETIVKKNNKNRSEGEYNFSYIKFAVDKKGNIYGIVSGKSSFHKDYPSDVWFYDIAEKNSKKVAIYMKEHSLKWYKKEIVILKNEDELSYKEAYDNERTLKNEFNLFD